MQYTIESLRDGGFVVMLSRSECERYGYQPLVFASASIDEALDYIKRQMTKPVQSSDDNKV
jgi:hypothetical protein